MMISTQTSKTLCRLRLTNFSNSVSLTWKFITKRSVNIDLSCSGLKVTSSRYFLYKHTIILLFWFNNCIRTYFSYKNQQISICCTIFWRHYFDILVLLWHGNTTQVGIFVGRLPLAAQNEDRGEEVDLVEIVVNHGHGEKHAKRLKKSINSRKPNKID